MKMIIQGYNKSIHKKNEQIIVKEKDNIIYRISAKKNIRYPNNRKRIHNI